MNKDIELLKNGDFKKKEMPAVGTTFWYWRCTVDCKKEYMSRSDHRHSMDVCECGKCGVDLEEHYARGMGQPEVFLIQEWDGKKWITHKDERNG